MESVILDAGDTETVMILAIRVLTSLKRSVEEFKKTKSNEMITKQRIYELDFLWQLYFYEVIQQR